MIRYYESKYKSENRDKNVLSFGVCILCFWIYFYEFSSIFSQENLIVHTI